MRWRLSPHLSAVAVTCAALLAVASFIRLGFWQWHRGAEGQREWQRFARGAQEVRTLDSEALASVPLYQRVSVTGTLDEKHQFLLDNRSYQGRPGYEVLTPLRRAADLTLLVDRGWVPFSGSRAQLPRISLDTDAPVTLTGRSGLLPSAGLALGHAPPGGAWPKVTAFPSMAELAGALGNALEPRILLLDPAAPHGYVRDWQPPGMSPLRHFSYAIQWWSFAALVLLVWVVMAVRRKRGGPP
jgi:cytochrome oxidase assembly protein ShyY1